MIEVPADVLDIGRRIQDGDELWRGDPTMSLIFNTATSQFEVWGFDIKNEAYLAWSGPYCDQRILVELTETDWQRGSRALFDRILAKSKKIKDDAKREQDDIHGEMASKMAWAIKRELAAHLGGKKFTYALS